MGLFVTPEEIKTKTRHESIKCLESEDIEDRYIAVAERMIEEEFNLDLNTDSEPTAWASWFVSYPNDKTKYENDMRRSIYLVIDMLAVNPDGYGNQSVAGVSVSYSAGMPVGVKSFMRRWSQPNRIFRA